MTIRSQMTRDAAAALERAGFSRRSFLKGSGTLVIGFSAARLAETFDVAPIASAQTAQDPRTRLDSWIAIAASGAVTAYTGKCELGQGLFTAQMQLVAEELTVPIDRVTLIQCDTALTPDQGATAGAQSHRANFRNGNLALAAATARETLTRLAASRLGASAEQLTISDGVITVKDNPTRRVSYGELVGGRRFEIPLDVNARRKPSREWTILGKPVPRADLPALVTAQVEYVHNVRVPGMLHGRVVRPPAVGATLLSVDESSVKGMPGFVKVVVRQNSVGVVAEKPWQALQAANALKTTWSPGPQLPDRATYYDSLRTQPSFDTVWVDSGDVDATLARAATVIRATYYHPYQMHGSIASSCAVADVQRGKVAIWAATQNVYGLKNTTATILGVAPETIHVVYARGSGCYGLNGVDAVAFDAALMSQAVGRPVRVQLTRKDEMAWENYGVPYVIDQKVGLDASGTIIAWDYESWFAQRGGRTGSATPGNVVTGFLIGFQPAAFVPRRPAPATVPFNDRNNAPSYVTGCIGGLCDGKGTVASERAVARRVFSPFFTGPLRAPEQLQNTFAHECLMDEVAAHVKADPVAYRLRHLRDARLIEVINAATKAARWDPRPFPKPGNRRTGTVTGRGFAAVSMEAGASTNGLIAMVADIEVNQDSGAVVVKRLFISHDCGAISNPNGVTNQLEGAALQGLSRALGEEVTWDDQKITTVDWRSYRSMAVGAEMPVIETVLIDRPEVPPTGAGETGSAVVAAAVGNAIFDATGARLRQLPFTPARVRQAIVARATPPR